jgi:hypothetical protein
VYEYAAEDGIARLVSMSNDDHSTVDDWVHLPPSELIASVAIAPAPQIALASLRPMVSQTRDHDGRLVDWAIDVTSLIGQDADADADAELLSEYRTWRHTWRREFAIGPISNVATLLDETSIIEYDDERHLDALLQHVLAADGATVAIAPQAAETIISELEIVRLALSVDERLGTGLVDDMPTRTRSIGLARTWAPPRHESVLSATPVTSVLLRPDEGLVLVHGEPPMATTFTGVTAVDMRADSVLILNDRGSSMRLTQSDARPLGWIVPRSLRWHLRQVPLVSVWTLLFDGLGKALRVGADRGVPVLIDARSMLGPAPPITEFHDT